MKHRLGLIMPLVACAVGCSLDGGNGANGRTILLLDVGDSTIQMQESYREDLQKLFSSIPLREEVIADTISYNSLGNSNPISLFFGTPGQDVTAYQDRPAAARARTQLSEWLTARLANRTLTGARGEGKSAKAATDIMSAIVNAQRLISGKGPDRRRLILFSDMIEQSAALDLTTGKLEPADIEQHLLRLDKEGLVPNLKGVEVWIVGLGAVPDGTMSSSRVAKIRRFWEAYFTHSKASYEPRRWGTRLLLRGDE